MASQRPTRIVHITATPIGAPWMVALAREQLRLGHEVSVILPSTDGPTGRALAEAGVPCLAGPTDILSIPGMAGRAFALARLVRILRRMRPDVVHSHILNSVVTARLASWIADVPNRFGGNVGPFSIESDLLRPLEIGTAFCDTRTIASCEHTRTLFRRHGIPEERLDLVYYAVDQSGFDPALADGGRVRRELGIADGAPVIGKVAYFYAPGGSPGLYPPRWEGRGLKGHDVLLRAVPLVLAQVPDARFVLAGGGWGEPGDVYMGEMQCLARDLGIEHAVIFTGERRDVPDVLAALDVSVHCSLNDNLGGTVESLLMARPFVVSDIPGYADTVLHERTGLRVPVDDPAALAEAIVRLIRDPVLGRRLGEEGRRWMLERFTLTRSVADLEEVLARSPARAETHYRVTRTITRALAAPLRVLPPLAEFHRVLRRATPVPPAAARRPFPRLALMWAKYAVRGALKSSTPLPAGRPLRIAQVAGAWQNCDWFVDVCRALAQRGHEVVAVIDTEPGDLGERLRAAGIPVHRVSMTFATGRDRTRLPAYAAGLPLAALRVARVLRAERVDVVHSHIFTSVFVARLAAALARVRHVAMIPGPRHLEAPLTRRADRLTWWLDDATLAGCDYTGGLYASLGANAERLRRVYYGVRCDRFDPRAARPGEARHALGVPADAPLVSMVAHFYAPTRGAQTPPRTARLGVKGHHDFLAAARGVAESYPHARFVLAGAGVMAAGEAYRRRLAAECEADPRLRGRVVFAGRVDDVASLLAASDVTVQCSLSENLGGTIEALLMERPVVATRVGGMPEAVRHEETGLLVPPGDPAALAAAIERLLGHPAEAAALGRAGRRRMLDIFGFERMMDEIEAVYRGLGAAA